MRQCIELLMYLFNTNIYIYIFFRKRTWTEFKHQLFPSQTANIFFSRMTLAHISILPIVLFTLFPVYFFCSLIPRPSLFLSHQPFPSLFSFIFYTKYHTHTDSTTVACLASAGLGLTMKRTGNVRDPLNLNPLRPTLPAAPSSSPLIPNIHLQPQARKGCQAPLCRPVRALWA